MSQYRGELSPKQAADGINAARRNARRLVHDAELLFVAGRLPTAVSVAILAIEEAGKAPILRGLLGIKDPAKLKLKWKEYRNHCSKNVLWLFPVLVEQGVRKLSGFAPLFDPKSDHPQILDNLKQVGFYTDCFNACHWSEPEAAISRDVVESILNTAKLLSNHPEVTERELELWVEHVAGKAGTLAKEGLRAFYNALADEGLSYGDIDDTSAFLE
ncbi:MAG: AbiV family abortive infection protein [Pseudomonadota bacterium]